MSPVNLLALESNVYHQFTRLQSFSEGWQWMAIAVAGILLITYTIWIYRRDSVELSRGVSWLLVALRLSAFLGILIFFLNLEKRSERQLVKNSRALLLIDTSQSMGLHDSDASQSSNGPSRIDHVIHELQTGAFLASLRTNHDVIAYRFDQGAKPIEFASFPKLVKPSRQTAPEEKKDDRQAAALRQSQTLALIAVGALAFALVTGVLHLRTGTTRRAHTENSWFLLASMLLLIISLVFFGVADLRSPDTSLLVSLGLQPETSHDPLPEINVEQEIQTEPQVNWSAELIPQGAKTRLGDAVRYLVNKERGGPIAGIILFSDGRLNDGMDHTRAVEVARTAKIPVHCVGLGSDRQPRNVRVVDLEAPPRVYPGDDFTLTAYIQNHGYSGRSATVELLSGKVGASESETQLLEDQRTILLGESGVIDAVTFEATPVDRGRREYTLRIVPPNQDQNPNDNRKSTTIDIIERKAKILLIAGGPTREFRFLRNQLYRDKDSILHVWLQSGQPGISQESDELLFEFPALNDELYEYDCIIAFDPNWEALDELQAELLEKWVAEKAGGLIAIAGPVFTPEWTRFRRGRNLAVDTIKRLYPVSFFSQGSAALQLGRFGAERAWPLEFTRDGLQADFLWLEESPTESERTWASFEGVYGYYAVKEKKRGAKILAHFSDSETAIDEQLPIYLANHFYGAGRVFFQASGEMWRLRAMDEGYFEMYYTKLIRWASQGRILRDSTHGVLLTDKERCSLGEHVVVRAMLQDERHAPLDVNDVESTLVLPDGTRKPLQLPRVKDASRDGMFSAQFTVMQEGNYRIELSSPGGGPDELLTREVRVVATRAESERPERNDALMKELADKTGGQYFIGVRAAVNQQNSGRAPLANLLEPQDQVSYLPGTPDRKFEEVLMTWLMILISGVLCCEWLIRRLSRLA